MRNARRDANEREILRGLRDIGAWYRQMPPGVGFDLLVGFRGQLYIAEIKDPAQPPSKQVLTAHEKQTVVELASVDVTYWVWRTLDDALQAIGAA